MDEEYEYAEFQEMVVGDPESLVAAIEAAEILMLGFEITKEAVLLKDENDDPAEFAVHFRMKLFRDPKLVPAQEIPR